MRENYYKLDQKKKQSQKNRTFLLTGIAVLVCLGVLTTSAVMYSTVGQKPSGTGQVSSVNTLLSASSDLSSAAVSSEEASSAVISSEVVSSEVISSEVISSEVVASEAVSSELASYVPTASAVKASSAAASEKDEIIYYETPNYLKAEFDFSKPVTESEKVPLSYFDDAVLIGESRADGLVRFTNLQNHITSLAKTSCTAKMVLEGDSAIIKKIEAKPGTYKKAYIMLGLNEISHDYTTIMSRYGTIIDRIRKSQPDIVVYLQTVLPITKYVQNNHSYLRKEKIIEFNKRLAKLAVEKEVYLVDPTSVFIGSDGYMVNAARASANNLNGEYHFNGTYSQKWLDYLCTHTVK